jgi:hypothetical protein
VKKYLPLTLKNKEKIMQDKNPIKLKVEVPKEWEGKNIVAYFQATIAGGYAQKVHIVNDERVFREVTGETPGADQRDFGKQFLNNKQNVVIEKWKQHYNFNVLVEHNKGKGWEQSDMKCESVIISKNAAPGKTPGNAAFGIVISDDKWAGDTDFNDCVVIISLYKGRE